MKNVVRQLSSAQPHCKVQYSPVNKEWILGNKFDVGRMTFFLVNISNSFGYISCWHLFSLSIYLPYNRMPAAKSCDDSFRAPRSNGFAGSSVPRLKWTRVYLSSSIAANQDKSCAQLGSFSYRNGGPSSHQSGIVVSFS